jgi:sugar phosphate isomerase/epimerase
MGCGLWLPAPVAAILAEEAARLNRLLEAQGLFLYTLNGFPFGDFHQHRVKEAVYEPAWDQRERLGYTIDLARILAHSLPDGSTEGTISTVPLGYEPTWNQQRQKRAVEHLCHAASLLSDLRTETRKSVRLCLEPEPGCALEATDQAIRLFAEDLPAAAAAYGIPESALRNHLGICLDVCHQAVVFEEPDKSLARMRAAGVSVAKIQLSNALEMPSPQGARLADILWEFNEPRYLHQVRTLTPEGELTGAMDLADVLAATSINVLPEAAPWRIHFHVPLQQAEFAQGLLCTTQQCVETLLRELARDESFHPHLEVETYSWQLLPRDHRPTTPEALEQMLAEEIAWLETRMRSHGLLSEEHERDYE